MAKKNVLGSFSRPVPKTEADKERNIEAYLEAQADSAGAREGQDEVLSQNRGAVSEKPKKTQRERFTVKSAKERISEVRSLAEKGNADSDKDFSVRSLLKNKVAEPSGYVRRNFSVLQKHMNRIKRLTIEAKNRGFNKTQDDILNGILGEYFGDETNG